MRHTASALLGIVLLAGLCPGCASSVAAQRTQENAGQPADARWPENSDAYRTLRELARSGATQSPPIAATGDLLQPLAPDDPARAQADLPLEDVIERLALEPPESVAAPPEPPNPYARMRAQRLYSAGVARLLDGDAAAAVRDFAGAAQLDPSAPAPWLRLAEAQAAQGQSAAALLSYKKAADLGADHPLALTVLGMQANRTGQQALAAHYLSRAIASQRPSDDPLLRNVAHVHLGESLRSLGYLRASIDALRQGLATPRRAMTGTRFVEDARDIAQRASDIWRDIGDMATRLGDGALADEAYANAASLPSLDPSAILARRMHALLQSGQAADAAVLLLDDIASRGGRADNTHLDLLRTLRGSERVGSLTAEALADMLAALPRPLAPSTASAVTLAAAAVAPTAKARELLMRRLEEAPLDSAAAAALFELAGSDEERMRIALELVKRSPRSAQQIGRLLVAWHARPGDLPTALPASLAGRTLALRSQLALGLPVEPLVGPGTIATPTSPAETALLEAQGLAAAALGRWDLADRVAEALAAGGDARARAAVLRASQRYGEALEALRPTLETETTTHPLLRASELALATGDRELAEELLLRAKAIDPYEEGSYEGLLTIYQEQADQQRAAETVRELRERVPSGRLLRWVNAQEQARRGMFDEAERSLRDLLDAEPTNAGAQALLLQIWQQRARAEDAPALADARVWLERRVASPPFSADAIALLARLLMLEQQYDRAETLLRDAAAARPSPAIDRAREDLARRRGDGDRADAMALDRLSSAGRGIDTSIEFAETLARAGEIGGSIERLRDAVPPRATLASAQESRLFAVLLALAGRAEQSAEPEHRELVLQAVADVESRGLELPWQVRYAAWTLLHESDAPDERITRATDAFVESVDSVELATSLLSQLRSGAIRELATLPEARAELAYTLANLLYAAGRADASLAAYRTALRYDQNHAWAANDLGYFLLERHERIDEAERLLERAYRLEPDEASIVDSLGWLRYKLGHFEDRTLEGATREGAVSLLTAATALPAGAANPTIHDHLGDALWRAGDRDRAEAMWLRAQQLLVSRLVQLRDGGASPLREQITSQQNAVGAKLDALRAGEDPAVAPLLGEH